MVSKASDDLPEPERPVMTISLLRGSLKLILLRLCTFAPRIIISSVGIFLPSCLEEPIKTTPTPIANLAYAILQLVWGLKQNNGLSLFPLAASDHLGAGDIALLIYKIKIAGFLFHANLDYLLNFTAFFAAPRHLGARDIAMLIDKIEVTFLSLYSRLFYFLCHNLLHPLSNLRSKFDPSPPKAEKDLI